MKNQSYLLWWVFIGIMIISCAEGTIVSSREKNTPETETSQKVNDFSYETITIVTAKGKKIIAEIADTPAKRKLGLGYRSRLESKRGMLFIFDDYDRHSFWMKNMVIPIDILWLDNSVIVHVESNVPPPKSSEKLKIYKPFKNANLVLELPAGEAEKLNLHEGASVQYQY